MQPVYFITITNDSGLSLQRSSVVGLSVCRYVCVLVTFMSPAKNCRTARSGCWLGLAQEPCIRQGCRSPSERGFFLGGEWRPIVNYRDIHYSTVSCAKTAEPIEMRFGIKTRVVQGTVY